MKKSVGRPKLGKQNAKGKLFAARFTPPEAARIEAAIRRSEKQKSDWIRKALLHVAEEAGIKLDAASLGLAIRDCKERGFAS